MAQFDVYRNPNPETSTSVPYLLDVQAETFEPLATHLVIPLVRKVAGSRLLKRLNLEVAIEGRQVFLSIPEMAGISVRSLGERVGNLSPLRTEIIAGIDFLITGS